MTGGRASSDEGLMMKVNKIADVCQLLCLIMARFSDLFDS